MESQHPVVDEVHKDYMQISLKKQNIQGKIQEIRENMKKQAKEFLAGSERLEKLCGMLYDLGKLIEEIQAMSLSRCKQMDDNHVYIWKINRPSQLTNDSRLIYSDRVQTSKWGYELGMSLEISMDEKGKQRYVILSFIIFRGAYDAILEWPFPYIVTLCLVDVMGTGKQIVYSIKPNSQPASFDRPSDDANPPYSIGKFCAVENLLESQSTYVSEDNIFFRLHVDFTKTGRHPF